MKDIVSYLLAHYYSHFPEEMNALVPTREQLENGLVNHPDKVVVVRDNDIRGVAIFLTLTDETYNKLETFDIRNVDVVIDLLKEHGDNIHFALLSAEGLRVILKGIKEVRDKLHPKTISWWNPDMTKLHKYNLN